MPSKYQKSTKPRSSPIGRKLPPTGTDRDLNLASMAKMFSDEDAAREFLEAKCWPDGPVCPHCGEHGAYKLIAGKKTEGKRQMRKGVYKCKGCRKQYTVRMGRIFEESKLPLRKWLMAIHLMTSSKKGISSNQLARELDCTLTTAWFLSHRIRECMKLQPMAGMLAGVVEADETYVGGKPRPKAGEARNSARGRGTSKTPVLALVQRNGAAVCHPLPNVTASEMRGHLIPVAREAVLMTDESQSYSKAGEEFSAHMTVNHSQGEYASWQDGRKASTNTAESFFALLKRGHYGIFHQLSKHHLHRYCDEFAFRWTRRKLSDGERMVKAIEGAEGKRLKYSEPINRLVRPAKTQA